MTIVFLLLWLPNPCTAIDPPNDECVDAIPIKLGDVMTHYTGRATTNPSFFLPTCPPITLSQRDLWYSYLGEGKHVAFTAITSWRAVLESTMAVYVEKIKGGAPCTELECVMAVSDGQPTAYWFAEIGKRYVIAVGGGLANLELLLFQVNGRGCEEAVEVEVPTAILGANYFPLSLEPWSLTDAGGVLRSVDYPTFYKVRGNGEQITVSTCRPRADYNSYSEYTTMMLARIKSDNDVCNKSNWEFMQFNIFAEWCWSGSAVRWDSKIGSTYMVVVGSADFVPDQTFIPWLLRSRSLPTNIDCDTASPLALHVPVSGDTFATSRPGDFASHCDGGEWGDDDLWYTLEGTGNYLIITTLVGDLPQIPAHSAIGLYSDSSCFSFDGTCIPAENGVYGTGLGFCSEKGRTYFLNVLAGFERGGQFNIVVSGDMPCPGPPISLRTHPGRIRNFGRVLL